MIDDHKLIKADDVIESLNNAIEELNDKDSLVGKQIRDRVDELLGEISRTKRMEKEEKEREEAEKPYCSKEYIVVVYDPKGTVLPDTLEGYVFQKNLSTRRLTATLEDADFAPEDWPLREIDSRLERYILNQRGSGKKGMAVYVTLDEFMEHGNKTELKKWGLDRKTKTPAIIMPVKLQVLDTIKENLNAIINNES